MIPPRSETATPSSAVRSCAEGQTQLHLDRLGGPVSSQYFAFFSFTNTSSIPCTMDGYPSPNVYDAQNPIAFSQVDGNAYPINNPPGHVIELAPGVSAYFGLGWAAVNQGDGGSLRGCVSATNLNVLLPGSLASAAVQATLPDICPDGNRQPTVFVTTVAFGAAFAAGGGPAP